MRPDQKIRLADVAEKLAEVVIQDADPATWAASGVLLCDMTREQRGDAAWCRKTAIQSVALLVRVEQLNASAEGPKDPEDLDTESEIKRAERAAAKLLEKVGGGRANRS